MTTEQADRLVLRVSNWGDLQHYKHRRPPWIKLHRSLLDNYEFACLQDASRALAPSLWLLASEYDDGVITSSVSEICFRLRMSHERFVKALLPLISANFIECLHDASSALARCKQDAMPEKSREELNTHTSYESAPRSGVADHQKDNQQEESVKPSPQDPSSSSVPPKGGAAASIWGAPVHYLTAHGVPEARARSQIGKWLKSRDPQAVIDAITTAQLNAAVDPVAFITKVLLAGGSNGKIQGQYGRGGQSKHDAMAELKRFQRELEERERGGRDGLGEIIDI